MELIKFGADNVDNLVAQDPGRLDRLPFGAILAGRNRLVLSEIGWMPPVVGLILWAALLHFHRAVFGLPALSF